MKIGDEIRIKQILYTIWKMNKTQIVLIKAKTGLVITKQIKDIK